ncbi:hypothetical protein BDV93DRAFT_440797, partial [Ceratobasidium sp. AG-I]
MVALLNWSYRTATQAAQKLPDDWEKKCIDMAMRIAWIIDHFRIPASLVLNADQTGIVYVTSGSKTWDERGSKQVAVVNKDEKRQFTLMPTITASGKVLPSQAIFKGTSIRTLPSPASRRATEEKGFVYTSRGEKHWSTLDCMKEYILKIVLPYVAAERQRLKLPSSQRIILLLDCWSVHRSKEFLDWMRQNHSFIRIVFVPGGCTCTGKAQPCDINYQRPLKHIVKSECLKYLVAQTDLQLQRGIPAEKIRVDFTLSTLRNACTAWLLTAWN